VGRNLVENVTANVSGFFPDFAGRPVVNDDGWGSGVLIAPFANTNPSNRNRNFLRRYMLGISGGFGAASGGARGAELFGTGFKRAVKNQYGWSVGIAGSCETLRNDANFVEIDPGVKDAWGIPAVRIHTTFGENEQAMVRDIVEWGRRILESAGATVTGWQTSPSIPGGQIHEQGTCRMGDDPRKFVTNRWGQCHDVPNLLLADGSLHVSPSTQNPTQTILAISMRNAAHTADMARRRELG